ncbi:MAG TPA: hypothetical protein VFX69_08930 [Steroidobacteraceae bacterium]|nr:hypothetical protein [Steroidobacteraceae bacterium]
MARTSIVVASLVLLAATAPATARASACAEADRDPYAARSFHGHACHDGDCAAHKAGFGWADRQGLADPAACAEAEDAAFVEGCRAFAELAVTAEQSGFEWARENQLADDCLCDGAGPRFAAGCEAFVRGFGQ